jgi:hypothetical protein
MKKATSFKVGIIFLAGMFILTLFLAPEALTVIGPAVAAGVVGACGFHQGTGVADNWQRSKYYQPALDKKGTGVADNWQRSEYYQPALDKKGQP